MALTFFLSPAAEAVPSAPCPACSDALVPVHDVGGRHWRCSGCGTVMARR